MTLHLTSESAPNAVARVLVAAFGDRNIRQAALAWGISPATLWGIVTGKRNASRANLATLAAVEEIDAKELAAAVGQDLVGDAL